MVTALEYQRVEREVACREGKRGFAIHRAVYAGVMTTLVILNLLLVASTDANFLWFPSR